MLPIDSVTTAMAHPQWTQRELDKLDAEDSLLDFMKLTWHTLEPLSRKFVAGWAIEAICDHLQAVSKGEIKNLLINVPPGFSKSMSTNVFWPAWEWGPRNRPDRRHLSFSYSEKLTIRDNRRCRMLMQGDTYQELWGDRFTFSGDQNAKMRFENNHMGWKIASSIGGVVMGERGDVLVVDDPNNVKQVESDTMREDVLFWLSEVLPTRVNDPGVTPTVIIMQRVHERDVSGFILAKELDYTWLCLPMEYEEKHRCYTPVKPTRRKCKKVKVSLKRTVDEPIPLWVKDAKNGIPLYPVDPRKKEGDLLCPERFSLKYLEGELKPALMSWGGSHAVAGQLQQRPAPRGGGMFKREWLPVVDYLPKGPSVACRGWDLAATSEKEKGKKKSNEPAWTVGVLERIYTKTGHIVVEDVIRLRGSAGEVEQAILAAAVADGRKVLISIPQDPGQAGKAQKVAYTKLLHGYQIHFSPETGDKELRAKPLAAQAEYGNVSLLRGPWNGVFHGEATVFPASKFKDQIDAWSRADARLRKDRAKRKPAGGEVFTDE